MTWFARMTFGERVVALLVLAALAVLALAALWGRVWSLFPGSAERRADRAEAVADRAQKDATARALEVEGLSAAAARVEQHYRIVETARGQLAALEREIDHDQASQPLREDVARALRAHDRQLCQLGPACAGAGGAAPAGAAGGGQ